MQINEVRPTGKYKLLILCRDCGGELNSTIEMAGEEMRRVYQRLVIGSALQAGKCSKGCRSTFSDCNTNTDLQIREVQP